MGQCWVAALTFIQLVLGERADCARSAKRTWFKNLNPLSNGNATVEVPETNGKTQARSIHLPTKIGRVLWSWMHEKPLKGPNGASWPFPGQVCEGDVFLFPGLEGRGKRKWTAPVSERGYLYQLRAATKLLARDRASARATGRDDHVFEDVCLERVGTHSMKKSAVTLLADNGVSTTLVSCLTGTTIPTLQR